MGKLIRVMLCDDSSTMRRLIKTALKREPRIIVVYQAKNGKDAIENLDANKPDIVVMDVEMPVMDGIVATREIRKRQPRLPVLMFSSLTSRGAEATLDALAAGASDFAVKPASAGHIDEALKQLQDDLIPKILKLVSNSQSSRSLRPQSSQSLSSKTQGASATQARGVASKPLKLDQKIEAVAIGVSTGGPQALATLLRGIPVGFATPILIAQHMPPVFTTLLAQRLSAQTGHKVVEATDGNVIKPGMILLAPGDYHLTVYKAANIVQTRLGQEAPENSCRPAADPLFRSVAKCYGKKALGVVLTGMGQDGMLGAGQIKSLGGNVIVQDESSSVIWGMPGKVVNAGFADSILPLDQIAAALSTTCRRPALAK